jgi:hypothetical protein
MCLLWLTASLDALRHHGVCLTICLDEGAGRRIVCEMCRAVLSQLRFLIIWPRIGHSLQISLSKANPRSRTSSMHTRMRHITSSILLASYLLAGASAWLHTAHQCGSACRPNVLVSVVTDHATCGSHHHGGEHSHVQSPESACHPVRLDPTRLDPVRNTEQAESEGPSHAPRHRHDDCTLCRFQLTKKLVEFVPTVAAFSTACSERIALELPRCRVAQLQATPDGRAPPKRA